MASRRRTSAPKRSARKLHIDLGADCHLICGAHHISLRIGTDGVAALQDAQRTALIELQAQPFELLNFDQKPPNAQSQRWARRKPIVLIRARSLQ